MKPGPVTFQVKNAGTIEHNFVIQGTAVKLEGLQPGQTKSATVALMFSMAGGTLVLPFLPMLPAQILLNNLLYDLSEISIPMDSVDPEDLIQPRSWDMTFVRNFMVVIGPVSSIFDFLTFYILFTVFSAHQALFHTGWFIESIATQVLVIFVIRTRRSLLRSRPHPLLTLTSLAVVALAIVLPYTPLAARLGFVPPPPVFFPILGGMVVSYLLAVEGVKRWFYRHFAASRGGSRSPASTPSRRFTGLR